MSATARDPRANNRIDPASKLVHLRLEVWGRWAREHVAAWPAVTMLGRVIEQGANGASQTGKPPISMPQAIAETDAAVGRLSTEERQALITYYTQWAPVEVMAKKHCCGVRQFQNILRRARGRLSLVLT